MRVRLCVRAHWSYAPVPWQRNSEDRVGRMQQCGCGRMYVVRKKGHTFARVQSELRAEHRTMRPIAPSHTWRVCVVYSKCDWDVIIALRLLNKSVPRADSNRMYDHCYTLANKHAHRQGDNRPCEMHMRINATMFPAIVSQFERGNRSKYHRVCIMIIDGYSVDNQY